jgi:hypothetical protein
MKLLKISRKLLQTLVCLRPVSVFEENPSVFGFSAVAQNQILRFGFNKSAKALDISEPIKDGNRYVVVQLVKIKLEGVPDLEDARQAMETDAKNKLIGDRYIKEMGNSTDLNKLFKIRCSCSKRRGDIC